MRPAASRNAPALALAARLAGTLSAASMAAAQLTLVGTAVVVVIVDIDHSTGTKLRIAEDMEGS